MNPVFIPLLATASAILGAALGYWLRQWIAKKNYRTIEAKLQKKLSQVKTEANRLIEEAKEKANRILETNQKEIEQKRRDLFQAEQLLIKREHFLGKKSFELEKKEKELEKKIGALKKVKESLEAMEKEAVERLEKIAKLSKEEAKKELLKSAEKEYQKEILERIKKLEEEGIERYQKRAKEILAFAIQKLALSQAQEITTTTISLPSDEIKGRIIGKEGRNIRTLEKLTGVEIIIDETPETLVISGFDPVRRQVAKLALEKLIQDGRIQPARIEEAVKKAEKEIANQIKEAGEQAVHELGIIGLDPRLIQLLGRLRFRTSFGQNVLLHSIEVALLAGALAAELGANVEVAKKAGLLHDIGKALDHQVEGSHTEIGIKVLEKLGVEKEVIDAMKSHHEEYPYQSLEAIVVQVADQISGARPGARKDTLENYLKRLESLENIANTFPGVEKSYAIQAGRELRVFVKPKEVDDLSAKRLAKDIANRIQEELKYPGEIKVTVIRESRFIEYAK